MEFKVFLKLFFNSLLIGTTLGSPGNTEQENTILDRLQNVEAVVKLQQSEIVRLREENNALVQQQAKLEADNNDLVEEINRLKVRNERQNARIELLEKNVFTSVVDKDVDVVLQASNANGSFGDRIKEITKTENKGLNQKKSHNRIRQVSQEMQVSFFATRTAHSEHMGQNQPVVFDNVITNIGNGYHSTAGIFTVPQNGVYVFSTTLLLYQEDAHFVFTVNGKTISWMFSSRSDAYETLSQTTVLNLTAGDDVGIMCVDSDKFVHGGHYSTFTGFLLYSN